MQQLIKYLEERQQKFMSVSFHITRITLTIALVALAGCLAYLGVVFHDDWAKSGAMWAVIGAVTVHLVPWLLTDARQ